VPLAEWNLNSNGRGEDWNPHHCGGIAHPPVGRAEWKILTQIASSRVDRVKSSEWNCGVASLQDMICFFQQD